MGETLDYIEANGGHDFTDDEMAYDQFLDNIEAEERAIEREHRNRSRAAKRAWKARKARDYAKARNQRAAARRKRGRKS